MTLEETLFLSPEYIMTSLQSIMIKLGKKSATHYSTGLYFSVFSGIKAGHLRKIKLQWQGLH